MASRAECVKVAFEGSPMLPYLLNEAATRAGLPNRTAWLRDRISRLLADEVPDECTYEELMADMPPTWEQNPGAVKLKSAESAGMDSVEVGQVG